ncbi:Disease resistance family protein [Rhynchospora pubera]|uniref:Disease resistance family protein n=1 Tax=Rhynchospora pubera TaxID=906938 RepID=A0AAV8FWE6_9POAL|nr:Disease resistance family protein [Rhynchospora pubera]KAJ4797557.1 Disease resistance family protein [Rhynchospora pubera]
MAESIVSFVVGKLGDVVVREVLKLHGVSEQVERVSRELNRIQAFLKDADRKRIVDERQRHWVEEVRDLAYSIEDVIDTFLIEVPEYKPGKKEAVKRWFTKTRKLPAVLRIGDEMNKIEARIQEIEASRVRYGIANIGESIEGEIRRPMRQIVLPDIDETGIVGFEADIDKIVFLLLHKGTTRRAVVSIVGTGGLGKTTLARKVYNSEAVKRQFHVRIWVVISQKYELIDILRNIAKQLEIQPPKDLSEHELTKLHKFLTGKRYLLVLDDIWENNNPWTEIQEIFPNSNNGSRILMTSRFSDIAEKADPKSRPYKLQFLTPKASLELFLKKAFPNHNVNEEYPDDLYNIAKQFSERCGGLPLALIVLGGLLSKKAMNYGAWSRVMKTMGWSTDGKECIAILSTSFEDLPFALKSCFMYFAMFPEDEKINGGCLTRMWIAEGFIPQEENRTLEDTADNFLEDLAQRSMIQVSRFSDGSIGECHIHDLLHGLVIQKAKDDNFLMVCSKIDEMQNRNHMRRLAIHDSLWNCEDEKTEELHGKSSVASATPNLRSLFSCRQIPKVLQLMHLKVLSNTGSLTSSEFDHLVNYRRLNQLRYVQLKLLVQCRKDIQNFEKFIAGLRFLQTLDIRNSDLSGCNLPDCVWHIKTLRHVLLPRTKASAYGPPPSVDLINLQTLFGVISRETWGTEGLPKLPNLIALDFRTSNGFQWNTIVALLGTLEHLLSLGINGDDASLNIIDMKGFPFYHHLQELSLSSNTKKIALHHGMFPIHLTTLILELQFQQDPMPVLEKLQHLRFLSLRCCNGEQLCCSTGGFGQLEKLMIDNLCELEELKIEKGAMPMLKTFYVYNCPLLHVPPGLQHLTLLEEIKWSGPAMNETMEDEIRTICKMYLPFLSCP